MVIGGYACIWILLKIAGINNIFQDDQEKEFLVATDVPAARVWNVLWNMESFYQYTSPFCVGSSVLTSWQEGSEVRFLDLSGQGSWGRIVKNQPYGRM